MLPVEFIHTSASPVISGGIVGLFTETLNCVGAAGTQPLPFVYDTLTLGVVVVVHVIVTVLSVAEPPAVIVPPFTVHA
jgi:hypothetical protein